MLLTTATITTLGTELNVYRDPTNYNLIAYTDNGYQDGEVRYLNQSVTQLTINGSSGQDTITLDFSDGMLPLPDAGITFNGASGSTNSFFIVGGGENDSVVINPSNNLIVDDTSVTYDNTVSQIQYQLNGGNNSVEVAGGVTFDWNSDSFPPAENQGNIALTVDSDADYALAARKWARNCIAGLGGQRV